MSSISNVFESHLNDTIKFSEKLKEILTENGKDSCFLMGSLSTESKKRISCFDILSNILKDKSLKVNEIIATGR